MDTLTITIPLRLGLDDDEATRSPALAALAKLWGLPQFAEPGEPRQPGLHEATCRMMRSLPFRLQIAIGRDGSVTPVGVEAVALVEEPQR